VNRLASEHRIPSLSCFVGIRCARAKFLSWSAACGERRV
jgi:hypothetical protein